MTLLFSGKKTEVPLQCWKTLCFISETPIMNRVSSTKDSIKFWNLRFLGSMHRNVIVFPQREFMEVDSHARSGEKHPVSYPSLKTRWKSGTSVIGPHWWGIKPGALSALRSLPLLRTAALWFSVCQVYVPVSELGVLTSWEITLKKSATVDKGKWRRALVQFGLRINRRHLPLSRTPRWCRRRRSWWCEAPGSTTGTSAAGGNTPGTSGTAPWGGQSPGATCSSDLQGRECARGHEKGLCMPLRLKAYLVSFPREREAAKSE